MLSGNLKSDFTKRGTLMTTLARIIPDDMKLIVVANAAALTVTGYIYLLAL